MSTVVATIDSFPPLVPSNPLAEARSFHAQNQLLAAAEAYRLALQSDPDSQTALLGLSLLARQTRQFEPALHMAQAALASSKPQSSSAALAFTHVGHCLFSLRRMPEAQTAFEQALAISSPSNQPDGDAAVLAHIGLGELFFSTRRAIEAIPQFQKALALRPILVAAHYGLGNALAFLAKRPEELQFALDSLKTAAALAPGSPEAHFAIGFLESRLGRHAASIAAYRTAVRLRPGFASAWLNLGVTLIADGRDQFADPCYRQALAVLPAGSLSSHAGSTYTLTGISAHLNRGHLARSRHHFLAARQHYDQALHLAPEDNPLTSPRRLEIFVALAYCALEQSRFSEAWHSIGLAEEAEAAHACSEPNPEIPNARGILLLAQTCEDQACSPQNHQPRSSTEDQDCPKVLQAIQEFIRAEALGHKTAASNRGNALLRIGQCRQALAAHQTALELAPIHPGVRYNLALTQLRLGDYASGWPNYEIRWSFREVHARPRRFPQPRWNGESLTDFASPVTLLIYAEQGLGDTIQFFRYLPLLIARLTLPAPNTALSDSPDSSISCGPQVSSASPVPPGSQVLPAQQIIFEVQPRLERLLTYSLTRLTLSAEIKIQVVPHGKPLPAFTHHCPLLSLPAVFTTTLETIPLGPHQLTSSFQYLHADPDLVMLHGKQVAASVFRTNSAPQSLRIGLGWAGNPAYRADLERSTQLATFLPLLEIPNLAWISLQKGVAVQQISSLPSNLRLMDACSNDQDLADTAALIQNLDLVISTDTVIAHLAGALGKPLWLLLPWQSDWRWMQDIPDSPWYPTARLYRQSSRGDWPGLIARVAGDLRQLATNPSHRLTATTHPVDSVQPAAT